MVDFNSGVTRIVGDLDLKRIQVFEGTISFILDLEELNGSHSPWGRCGPKDMIRRKKSFNKLQ